MKKTTFVLGLPTALAFGTLSATHALSYSIIQISESGSYSTSEP